MANILLEPLLKWFEQLATFSTILGALMSFPARTCHNPSNIHIFNFSFLTPLNYY